jgi:hypothetical protein
MDLGDVSLGYDPTSALTTPSVREALDSYVHSLAELPGAHAVRSPKLKAYEFSPADVVALGKRLVEVLADLVQRVSAIG